MANMRVTGNLQLEPKIRRALWRQIFGVIEDYFIRIPRARVAPSIDLEGIRSSLSRIDFEKPLNPCDAVSEAVESLWRHQVHTPHPRYFGLFNPAPTSMGIAADALVAAFNPQLAAWSHSPYAVETERYLIRVFGERFGYLPDSIDGTFTSGGAEANHTAILTALVHHFPSFASEGLRKLEQQPVLYASAESHHSFLKAARFCGLGTETLRRIPVNDKLQLDIEVLQRQISRDRADGLAPFLVVGTAGTTNAGIIDPLHRIGEIAEKENLWFHVDAAWGGAAALIPEIRTHLTGIERSDSITFDPHKWLSVPMGAGMFLTRHLDVLDRTFRITTDYMPKDAQGLNVADPHAHSLQWSRRFIGLKVLLSLRVLGWKGYTETIRRQIAMGDALRRALKSSGWDIVNDTVLPVICFVDRKLPEGQTVSFIEAVVKEVIASGKVWISSTRLHGGLPVLRACITNYRTKRNDVAGLVTALGKARENVWRCCEES